MRYLKPGDIFHINARHLRTFAEFFSTESDGKRTPVLMLALSVQEEGTSSELQLTRINLIFLIDGVVRTYYDIKSFSAYVQFVN